MLLTGKVYSDDRGLITYNNSFCASVIKRIYTIENHSLKFVRGWQGHKIEQRWFAAMKGSFKVSVICIDNFENPSIDLPIATYTLTTSGLNILHIPPGHITAIQALEVDSKLLVMADYGLGEVKDEYRYPIDYFSGAAKNK
jgi:dTDP-4-dehydrorhamnose 3,5-epimerase-like enzyme